MPLEITYASLEAAGNAPRPKATTSAHTRQPVMMPSPANAALRGDPPTAV